MNKIPKILYIARDDGGCGYFRCVQPANFLTRSGLADAKTILPNMAGEPTADQLLAVDLVIMQEMGSVRANEIYHFLLEHNIPFLAEFDDFIHHVLPTNLSGYGAWNPSTLYLPRAVKMAQSAFGLTVSTNQLAREYFAYNPTIYVIPNYLDKDRWDNPIVKRDDGKIRIGWFGGNAHREDLLMVASVIDRIVDESKGKVVFETMGMMPNELHNVFQGRSMAEPCPSCGYEGEKHHWPGESWNDYPMVLASKGWDIAIAPVIDNSFGNCKSDLKIKEYAAAGIPVIASPVVPYKEAAKNNAQVIFAESFEEWYNGIKALIKNPQRREEIQKQNKEWISQYWIQDNVGKIFEVYSQILTKAEVVLGKKKEKVEYNI